MIITILCIMFEKYAKEKQKILFAAWKGCLLEVGTVILTCLFCKIVEIIVKPVFIILINATLSSRNSDGFFYEFGIL